MKTVDVYTAEGCSACEFIKKYLGELDFTVNEIDTQQGTIYLNEISEMGISLNPLVLPVVKIPGKEAWAGMNFSEMSKLMPKWVGQPPTKRKRK